MNTTEITHPSHEKLSFFNSGRLGPIESAEVEHHLAECKACCQLLKTLPNDTLVSLLGPQSDTKAEAALSNPPEPSVESRPTLDVTIVPSDFKTQANASPITPSSTEAPAELQGHPRYRIQSLLGRGGMGSVYRAQHRVMNRPVALKVIDRQLVQTPGLVERFHREVQAAAKLAHPNIVTAYDAEQAGDLHFLVMELVEGQDLAEVVRQRGKLPVQEACEYARQAALGLQHASEKGMVHRDIKPQNLMLTVAGQIKILDFGLAQFATEIAETSGLTQVGAMMGTPDYMAPEQARDAHSADIRADIYSLGCTLYCLLSGGAPFPQGSIVEKIMAHVERQPAPLQELRKDVPPGLAAVLAKMMSKSPADRYQTPAEVAEALLPFASLGTAKIAAEVVSPIPKAAARPPRSPLFIATAVLGVLVTLVLLGVIVIVTDQGRIEVRSEVDDVDLIVKRGGEQIDIFDAQTGSKVRWFPSGKYELELKGNRNDIEIHNDGFSLTRWGKQIVTLTRKTEGLAGRKPESPVIGGHALEFDGKRANVRVAIGKPSRAETLTVEGWLKPTGRGTYQYPEIPWSGHVYRNDTSEGQTAMGLAYEEQEDGSQRWVLRIIAQEQFTAITSKDKCEFGKWTHVAAVIADKKMSLFVDGRKQGDSLPIAGFTDVQYSPFKLAGDSVVKGSFVGQFHKVRISTVARYDKDFTPQTRFERDKDTAALYQIGEGTGDVLKDSSGNGNNGWMVGAKWVEVEVTEVAGGQTTGVTPPRAVAPFNAEQAKQHQEAWAKHLGVPVEYTNSIGMKFRLIPPGEFLMGSTPAEIEEALKVNGDNMEWQQHIKSGAPQHKVILTQPIYLGIHEVTQAQYEKVTGQSPAHFASTGPGKDAVVGLDTSTFPVEMVNWNDAAEFCAKLSQKEKLKPFYVRSGETVTMLEGTGYRLPSEAHWEFACRSGTTTKYWIGDRVEQLLKAGWHQGNSGGRTHASGELKANPFGLYDIHGNVNELVQDEWEPDYYSQFQEQPAVNPDGPAAAGSSRAGRGGDWANGEGFGSSSHRINPNVNLRHHNIGFRVSLPVDTVRRALAVPAVNNAAQEWKDWPKDAPPPAIAPFDAEQAKQHQQAWARHLGVPVEYKNSIGMKFQLIPPGEFTIGSTPEEIAEALKNVGDADNQSSQFARDCVKSEGPQHKVILTQPRYLGVHEVTQSQYEKIMGKNPSHFAAAGPSKEAVVGLDTANHPVEFVSWNEAVVFCTKLGQLENLPADNRQLGDAKTRLSGSGYRLPTDAEWEFSCRAGTTTKFVSGDGDEQLDQTSWIGRNSGLRTHAVGELLANPFGLHDLQGNVWEWCHDLWELTYYNRFLEQPALDPTGPLPPGDDHLLRGGDWYGQPYHCRASFHHHMGSQYRDSKLGFRVSLSVEAVRMANMKPAVKKAVVPAGKN